jgi:hypothetical protein
MRASYKMRRWGFVPKQQQGLTLVEPGQTISRRYFFHPQDLFEDFASLDNAKKVSKALGSSDGHPFLASDVCGAGRTSCFPFAVI